MTRLADLHIHTHFSDGTDSPHEVVLQAVEKKISCISITDHDTIDGIDPTIQEANKHNIEVIPGIELSSEIHGKDVHILGYFIDHRNEAFCDLLKTVQNTRMERMQKMIEKLFELGIKNIELAEVAALAQSKAVGRPHLATVLMKKGCVTSIKEAFDRYLADGAPAYVPKFKQTPLEAIQLIKKFNGLSSLAHPMISGIDELIPSLVKGGLNGIEVYYANCTDSITKYYEGIAKKNKLCMTGGSDSHGKAKPNTYLGKMSIDYALVEKLKEALPVKR